MKKQIIINQEEKVLKIITIGPKGAGKSSLIQRVCQGDFRNEIIIPPVCCLKNVIINNQTVILQIWDFASQERSWQQLKSNYHKLANGILLMFDISSEVSFQEMVNCHQGTQYFNQETTNVRKSMNSHVPILLVGCKCDLVSERQVSYDVAYSFAHSLGMHYFETSAIKNINCQETIECITKQVLDGQNVQQNNKKC